MSPLLSHGESCHSMRQYHTVLKLAKGSRMDLLPSVGMSSIYVEDSVLGSISCCLPC